MDKWDRYFYNIALIVAKQSECLSRRIGAILVRDKSIISTGYNGPPRKTAHCAELYGDCPRRLEGYKSGEGLHLCPAAHAEANCITNAARNGINVSGASMYMTCELPCKNCLALIINAGICEIVHIGGSYDEISKRLLIESEILVRIFNFGD